MRKEYKSRKPVNIIKNTSSDTTFSLYVYSVCLCLQTFKNIGADPLIFFLFNGFLVNLCVCVWKMYYLKDLKNTGTID